MKKTILSKVTASVLSLALVVASFGSMSLQTRAEEANEEDQNQGTSYNYDDLITFFGFSSNEIDLNIGSVKKGQAIQLNVRLGVAWKSGIVETSPTWRMDSEFDSSAISEFGSLANGYMYVVFDEEAEINVGDNFVVQYVLTEMEFAEGPVILPDEKPRTTLKINIVESVSSEPSVDENDISKEESKSEYKAPTEEEIAEAISKAMEEKIRAEEAIPVTDFVSTEAVNAIPAEVKGNTSADVVFNVSKITTTRGFIAAVDKIVKANPEDKVVTFYSVNPFAFNENSLNALANANKDFVYMFKYDGKLYRITIPAGTKIDLDGQIFAGPLYIGAQLGTSVVVN